MLSWVPLSDHSETFTVWDQVRLLGDVDSEANLLASRSASLIDPGARVIATTVSNIAMASGDGGTPAYPQGNTCVRLGAAAAAVQRRS